MHTWPLLGRLSNSDTVYVVFTHATRTLTPNAHSSHSHTHAHTHTLTHAHRHNTELEIPTIWLTVCACARACMCERVHSIDYVSTFHLAGMRGLCACLDGDDSDDDSLCLSNKNILGYIYYVRTIRPRKYFLLFSFFFSLEFSNSKCSYRRRVKASRRRERDGGREIFETKRMTNKAQSFAPCRVDGSAELGHLSQTKTSEVNTNA